MQNQPEEKEEKLSLDTISFLGGNKEDLELINEVSDEEDEITFKDDLDDYKDEDLRKAELQVFIKSLGFNKLKKKLVVIKDDDEEGADLEQNDQKVNEELPGPREKKPRGNKFKQKLGGDQNSQSANHATIPNHNLSNLSDGPPKEHKSRNYMLIKPSRKWFESEIAVDVVHHRLTVPPSKIVEYERYSSELLQNDISLYKKYQSTSKNRSNFGWIHMVLKSGTTADKMAAYIVLLQDSPVHNLSFLESLIKLVDIKRKRECLLAVDTLKDLFTVDLLLRNRKLMPFVKQPLGSLDELANGNRDSYDKLLLLWHFESCLKQKYSNFVSALFKVSHDSNITTKRKAVKTIFELLLSNPEQEQSLLQNLVNKLGDPHHKIASQCSLLLCRLVDVHPAMKVVIVAEVERLLFRPGISPKAVYYAVCFLNQLILNPEDKELAAKLISIYFSLFKAATKTGEVETKLMSALLTGVNRAFPYAKPEAHTLDSHIDITYKIVHTTHFNVAMQAMMLIYHVLDSKDEFSDRFYSALYRKLLDAELKHSSKQAMFLNLLYKSLKKDPVNHRVYAFLKRIFQIAPEQTPGMICGLLFLVSEVIANGSCKLMLHSKEEDLDDEEEKFEDISDEEHDGDNSQKVDLEGNGNKKDCSETSIKTPSVTSSWVHRVNLTQGQNSQSVSENALNYAYNPFHRNPLFAGAIRTCPWELIHLSHHYHPSVALFASNLLSGDRILYTGDPLQDFTLIRFLDRFVYRNPKKLLNKGEESSQRAVLGRRKQYMPMGAKAHSINSDRFLQLQENAIPAEEKFFYKYFANMKDLNVKKMAVEGEDEDDIESVASEEFEMLLNRFEPSALKDEYELDFAGEMKRKSGETRKNGKRSFEDNSDDEGTDDDDEFEFDGDEEFTEAFKDFDDDITDACNSGDLEDNFDDDDDVDFSEEIMKKPKQNPRKFSKDDELVSNDDSNSELLGDDSANEEFIGDESDDEEFIGDESDDEEFIGDESDDEELLGDESDDEELLGNDRKKPKSSKKVDTNQLFASAEKFSAILDENIGVDKDTIGLEAMSNQDNAHVKQLRWEQERERWIRGFDWKNKKSKNNRFQRRKPTSKPAQKGNKRKRK